MMKIKNKRDWILAFLYSPGSSGDVGEPIDSSLRIMKNLFMLWQEGIKANIKLENIYEGFIKYNYGPCDFAVYEGIDELRKEGLIEELDIQKTYKRFKLTQKGIENAKGIYDNLSENVQKLMVEIKGEINSRSNLTSLLRFVYSQYPDWAENSLLKI